MSESDLDRLARLEAVDTNQAELALEDAGDFEEAREVLQKAPAAIKFQFKSDEDHIYGVGMVLLSLSPVDLKEFNSVVGNKEEFHKVSLNKSYQEFHSDITELQQLNSVMSALSEELNEELREEFSTPKTTWIPLVESRNEVGLQDELTTFLDRVLEPEEMEVTAELEVGLLDYEKGAEVEEEESDSNDQSSRTVQEKADSVTVLCDTRVNPLQGEPVEALEPGNMIFVELNDDNQNPTLLQVLERLRDERVGLIPAKIKEIGETESGKVEIIVQFGKNVYGRALESKGMNIMTPSALERREQLTSSFSSALKWGSIALAIIVIGLTILYALFLVGI